MKILWLGPFASDLALKTCSAANPAAMNWSRGLMRGLRDLDCDIHVVSHCPEQVWPRGRVFWRSGNVRWFSEDCPSTRIGYPNVVGLKNPCLDYFYERAVRKVIREWEPDCLICYNTLDSSNVRALAVAKGMGLKCMPIILDGDDPRKDDWGWIRHSTRDADGIAFLSWWMVQNCPLDVPRMHLDGGCSRWNGVFDTRELCAAKTPYLMVHTGALDKWRGLDFMKKVVNQCKRQDIKFVFCGKFDCAAVWREFGHDPRVDVRGFVSDGEKDALCRNATAFLNVREPSVGDNILNYPSKVPQYLSWGKPVVSTWIDSFSPDYRDVLETCNNTPEDFVCKMESVTDWTAKRRLAKYESIRAWFETKKTWKVQAERVLSFVRQLESR